MFSLFPRSLHFVGRRRSSFIASRCSALHLKHLLRASVVSRRRRQVFCSSGRGAPKLLRPDRFPSPPESRRPAAGRWSSSSNLAAGITPPSPAPSLQTGLHRFRAGSPLPRRRRSGASPGRRRRSGALRRAAAREPHRSGRHRLYSARQIPPPRVGRLRPLRLRPIGLVWPLPL